jgi:cell wall-associated NlpC family hydrolase
MLLFRFWLIYVCQSVFLVFFGSIKWVYLSMGKIYLGFALALTLLLSSCASSNKVHTTTTRPNNTEDSQVAKDIVKSAEGYIGTKYQSGGMDKKGMDCSGLVISVFNENGFALPRNSEEQSKVGKAVYIGELQKGDLIFFGDSKGAKKVSHVGIVSFSDGKEVKFIHASTSKGVREDDLTGYWRPLYIKARRVVGEM